MNALKLNIDIDFDKKMSNENFVDTLTSIMGDILSSRFADEIHKQNIIKHVDRLNFACPVCGDSQKNPYAKRGNIILSGKFTNFYKCHNCGEFKRIDDFLKMFSKTLNLEAINYISSSNFDSFSSQTIYDMSMFLDINNIEKYAIDRTEFAHEFNLVEVKNSQVWPWLSKRLQFDDKNFMYSPDKNYLVILNRTPSGKILGVQTRMFSGTNKYLTFNLSKIYELLHRDPLVIPDDINVISQLYNICSINYSKPVYLFEGAFDAFLLKNSVANAGANKSFPFDLDVRFFYDYDKTGIKKAIEKINEGHYIFLWGKYLKDVDAPFRKKWDLNDLIIWGKENNKMLPKFNTYFSNNSLDLIDL